MWRPAENPSEINATIGGDVTIANNFVASLSLHDADPLNRIKVITGPPMTDGTIDGPGNARTEYAYTDTSGAFSIQEQYTMTGSTKTLTTKNFDGLGLLLKVRHPPPRPELDANWATPRRSHHQAGPHSTTPPVRTTGWRLRPCRRASDATDEVDDSVCSTICRFSSAVL